MYRRLRYCQEQNNEVVVTLYKLKKYDAYSKRQYKTIQVKDNLKISIKIL